MSTIWHDHEVRQPKDYAEDERHERLAYLQDDKWPRFYVFLVWVLMIIVSAGLWGLALTVGRWIWGLL